MKKLLAFLFALTLVFVLASCGDDKPADSQGSIVSGSQQEDTSSTSTKASGTEITFTLRNDSELNFKSIAISEAGKEKWSNNLITGTLKSHSNATIKLNVPTNTEQRNFDLLATDTNGETTTFNFLNLSEATEKGGTISLYISEGGSPNAYFQPPYTEPTLTIDSTPTKLKYKVGEKYDPSGFSATYTDEDGVATKIGPDDVKFIVSQTVEITSGRAFVSAGQKVVVVHYGGLTQQFEITVE